MSTCSEASVLVSHEQHREQQQQQHHGKIQKKRFGERRRHKVMPYTPPSSTTAATSIPSTSEFEHNDCYVDDDGDDDDDEGGTPRYLSDYTTALSRALCSGKVENHVAPNTTALYLLVRARLSPADQCELECAQQRMVHATWTLADYELFVSLNLLRRFALDGARTPG